jgi:hypothetical protein
VGWTLRELLQTTDRLGHIHLHSPSAQCVMLLPDGFHPRPRAMRGRHAMRAIYRHTPPHHTRSPAARFSACWPCHDRFKSRPARFFLTADFGRRRPRRQFTGAPASTSFVMQAKFFGCGPRPASLAPAFFGSEFFGPCRHRLPVQPSIKPFINKQNSTSNSDPGRQCS